MATSMRCKLTGHDLDECGVCRRCGSEGEAKHDWQEGERHRPCFRLQVCSRCQAEKETPEHDWAPTGISPTGDPQLKCSRCGRSI